MELPVQWKLWITCILQTKYVFHHFPGRFPSYFIPRITLARRQLPLSPFKTWGVQKRTDLQDVIDVQLLLTAGVNGWNFSENRDRLLCSLFAAKKFKWFTFYRLFAALGSIMNIYQWQLEKPKLNFFLSIYFPPLRNCRRYEVQLHTRKWDGNKSMVSEIPEIFWKNLKLFWKI